MVKRSQDKLTLASAAFAFCLCLGSAGSRVFILRAGEQGVGVPGTRGSRVHGSEGTLTRPGRRREGTLGAGGWRENEAALCWGHCVPPGKGQSLEF